MLLLWWCSSSQQPRSLKYYSSQHYHERRKSTIRCYGWLPFGGVVVFPLTLLIIIIITATYVQRRGILTLPRLLHEFPTFKEPQQQQQQQQHTVTTRLNFLRDFEKTCRDVIVKWGLDGTEMIEGLNNLESKLNSYFTPPTSFDDEIHYNHPLLEPCMYTFIDLGANVGDSLGKFIDAGFQTNCTAMEHKRVVYSIEQGIVGLADGNKSELTAFVKSCITELGHHPEDYCYVGVEGNPVFTLRLKRLEARVMGTIPKPIRLAHFYTETIAAAMNGPALLYLDTINRNQNFWGSSTVRTHLDVQKSAKTENNASPVSAQVTGITLSTLLQQTVRQVNGAHVIIKMDIEGGEYSVMNEAIDTLCEFTKHGVQVDLILETHSVRVMGEQSRDLVTFRRKTKRRLRSCRIRSAMLSPHLGQ